MHRIQCTHCAQCISRASTFYTMCTMIQCMQHRIQCIRCMHRIRCVRCTHCIGCIYCVHSLHCRHSPIHKTAFEQRSRNGLWTGRLQSTLHVLFVSCESLTSTHNHTTCILTRYIHANLIGIQKSSINISCPHRQYGSTQAQNGFR